MSIADFFLGSQRGMAAAQKHGDEMAALAKRQYEEYAARYKPIHEEMAQSGEKQRRLDSMHISCTQCGAPYSPEAKDAMCTYCGSPVVRAPAPLISKQDIENLAEALGTAVSVLGMIR